ncbi:MAG: hypothetical protein KKA32_06480 [Actinobacteria bacterium]|nr:hypothetical protein [Actinomycetota bacterium]
MDWKTFRALETFAILYDIQIDEELYNDGPCQFVGADGKQVKIFEDLDARPVGCKLPGERRPWEETLGWTLDDLKCATLDQVKSLHVAEPPAEWPESLGALVNDFQQDTLTKVWDHAEEAWRVLLLAKLMRSELMRRGGTAIDALLDELAESLLKTAPSSPGLVRNHEDAEQVKRELGAASEGQGSDLPSQYTDLVLRVLCLIEASSCYHGYHQIAHAEDALKLLQKAFEAFGVREKDRIGQSLYEQVAIYNKAMGYMHVGFGDNYEQAAKNFERISRDCGLINGTVPDDMYAFEPARGADDWLYCFRWEDGKELLRAYIGHASVIQMADALNKLQRSTEALHCLNNHGSRPEPDTHRDTQYRRQCRLRVRHRCLADQDREPAEPLQLPTELKGRRRIESQFDSVEAESLRRCPRHLPTVLAKRAESAIRDREEFDQVLLEWAGGLGGAADNLKRVSDRVETTRERPGGADALNQQVRRSVEITRGYLELRLPIGWRDADTFFQATLDLLEDRANRAHRPEIARRTEKCLWDMWESAAALKKSLQKAGLAASGVGDSIDGLSRIAGERYSRLGNILCRLQKQDGVLTEYDTHLIRNKARRVNGRSLPSAHGGQKGRGALDDFVWEHFVESTASTPLERAMRKLRCRFCKLRGRDECTKPGKGVLCRSLVRAAISNPALTLPHPPRDDDRMVVHYCDETVTRNQRAIDARLVEGNRPRTPSGWGLAVLQRWNSFTPAAAISEGGGYLMTWFPKPPECPKCRQPREPDAKYCRECAAALITGSTRTGNSRHIGLAIDPGYGFVKNLLAQGYSIGDLTGVAVTHDHPDHLADFEAMHNLLIEVDKLNKKNNGEKKVRIELVVSHGALDHLQSIVDSSDVIRDTVVLRPSRVVEPEGNWSTFPLTNHTLARIQEGSEKLKLTATRAIHQDISAYRSLRHDSLGMLVEVISGADTKALVGFPSDTAWDEQIGDAYERCDVVCLHLGSISERSHRLLDLLNRGELDSVLAKTNHLFLPGVVWFTEKLDAQCRHRGEKLVVLSEFGEELSGGIRVMLAEALDAYFDQVRFLAGDVGLLVDPVDRSVRCSCCERFYPWATTEFEHEVFGDNEQIFYVCPACRASLSYDQRHAIFRKKQQPLMRLILEQ